MKLVDGVRLNPVGGQKVGVYRNATFRKVVLTASAGPLMLRNVTCYVEEDNSSTELTVGRPIMNIMGYSTDKFLGRSTRYSSRVGNWRGGVRSLGRRCYSDYSAKCVSYASNCRQREIDAGRGSR